MTSQAIMIEEATKAKAELFSELTAMVESGTQSSELFRAKVDALAYYNAMLANLGAGPNH